MSDSIEVISFKYNIKDNRGHTIESTKGLPISIVQGKGQFVETVEKALTDLKPGDVMTLDVKKEEAFGDYDESLVVQVPKSKFHGDPKIGDRYRVKVHDGSSRDMVLADYKSDVFILDGNHPLAGLDLTFEVELVNRRPASEDEVSTGVVSNKKISINSDAEA